MRFKVIQGGTGEQPGSPTGSKVWRRKWKQLKDIERTVIHGRRSTSDPRSSRAIVIAALSCAGVFAAFYALEKAGINYHDLPWKTAQQTLDWAPFVVAVLAYVLVQRFSSLPHSWTAQIDKLLAFYEPIDRDAYRRLQQRTQEIGYLESDFVREWIGFERSAIEKAAGWHRPKPAGFLNKRL